MRLGLRSGPLIKIEDPNNIPNFFFILTFTNRLLRSYYLEFLFKDDVEYEDKSGQGNRRSN